MPQEESSGVRKTYTRTSQRASASIDNLFPASKGAVRASKSELEAELVEYKNVTTAAINGLVDKVNALTPVGDQLDPTYSDFAYSSKIPCGISVRALCRDTMGPMG